MDSTNQTRGELNSQLGSTERFQINQAIEKRGGLRFNYAPIHGKFNTRIDANGNKEIFEETYNFPQTRKTWVPFFENPQISESRKANYASKKIFLRNEPVRLYTGSEARKFKIDIHYSLIHMAYMVGGQDLSDIFQLDSQGFKYQDVRAVANYLGDTLISDTGSTREAIENSDLVKEAYERSNVQDGPWGPNRWWKNPEEQSSEGSAYWNFALLWVLRTTKAWENHHKILYNVINQVRSAVIGSQQMPVKGPPIVELKWGTMYNYTPCIITDYKIQPVENAGYDTKSLTAQRLKISLSLEEMRNINGNQWGNPEIGGDLPGWDSIAFLGTSDPIPADAPMGPTTPNG